MGRSHRSDFSVTLWRNQKAEHSFIWLALSLETCRKLCWFHWGCRIIAKCLSRTYKTGIYLFYKRHLQGFGCPRSAGRVKERKKCWYLPRSMADDQGAESRRRVQREQGQVKGRTTPGDNLGVSCHGSVPVPLAGFLSPVWGVLVSQLSTGTSLQLSLIHALSVHFTWGLKTLQQGLCHNILAKYLWKIPFHQLN